MAQGNCGLIPDKVRPRLNTEEQDLLSEYAVGPRYPGWRDVTLAEARRAVTLARCTQARALAAAQTSPTPVEMLMEPWSR